MNKKCFLPLISACLIASAAMGATAKTAKKTALILATTTSVDNTGLLAYLNPRFTKATGIRVKVIPRGSGACLKLAREGAVDLLLAHDPAGEKQLLADGVALDRREIMVNDFVIIGPAGDPAKVAKTGDAVEAFRQIASSGNTFISRGDNSGTHTKELSLWKLSGTGPVSGEPLPKWYLSAGQGMGKVISIATEKRAYTLADRGTYYAWSLAQPSRTDLVVLSEGDQRLVNLYSVITLDPKKFPRINQEAAVRYADWISSPETAKLIDSFRIAGKVLFHPLRGKGDKNGG